MPAGSKFCFKFGRKWFCLCLFLKIRSHTFFDTFLGRVKLGFHSCHLKRIVWITESTFLFLCVRKPVSMTQELFRWLFPLGLQSFNFLFMPDQLNTRLVLMPSNLQVWEVEQTNCLNKKEINGNRSGGTKFVKRDFWGENYRDVLE